MTKTQNSPTSPMIFYVHGLQSTPRSFNFLKERFPEHDHLDVVYDGNDGLLRLVDALVEKVQAQPGPVIMVGHSLGGVIAAAAANRTSQITKVATMSSPFGGSEAASLLRWVCFSPSMDNIHPSSPLMRDVSRSIVKQPMLSVVSTAGASPFISGENDGVVTVASQRALRGPVFVSLPVNHFEVLLCEEVADLLGGFIFD